jgi:o-succinylbenzoate synthase
MILAKSTKKTFHFKQASGTSRGVLTEKHAWFIEIWDDKNPEVVGIGECSIIPGLSPDFDSFESYQKKLDTVVSQISFFLENKHELIEFPSILFGIECAELDLQTGRKQMLFDTDFTRSKQQIPINGLIWMGDETFMRQQVEEKLKAGFSCLKMKVGAIDFDREFAILKDIRARYSSQELILRVDANGAFTPENALFHLEKLASLELHSIEQPIRAGQIEEMARLCEKTPLPIALDEELIGIHTRENKVQVLKNINPQYIILKPSLHGGLSGSSEWIEIANSMQIPWWITSALESNIGLNAIAQFTSNYSINSHQGLGTGSLYVDNVDSRLRVENGFLLFG